MKAVVCTKYGKPEVLEIKEVSTPSPKSNEVLIKVHSTTITMGDCEIRTFKFPAWLWLLLRLFMGVFRPRNKIFGQELSGTIESIGEDVSRFKRGDEVVAATSFRLGAHAEFIKLRATGPITHKPENISFIDASTLPVGGLNAYHFLRNANIQEGDKVLINGAGGTIGTYAVQIAKHLGATVTSVDSSEKLEMLQSIGSDRVLDYAKDDILQLENDYDVIFDVIGKIPFSKSMKALKENGRLLLSNPKLLQMIRGAWVSRRSDKKVVSSFADYTEKDLEYVVGLMKESKIHANVDKIFEMKEAREAHSYVESGQKKGHVVLKIIN